MRGGTPVCGETLGVRPVDEATGGVPADDGTGDELGIVVEWLGDGDCVNLCEVFVFVVLCGEALAEDEDALLFGVVAVGASVR